MRVLVEGTESPQSSLQPSYHFCILYSDLCHRPMLRHNLQQVTWELTFSWARLLLDHLYLWDAAQLANKNTTPPTSKTKQNKKLVTTITNLGLVIGPSAFTWFQCRVEAPATTSGLQARTGKKRKYTLENLPSLRSFPETQTSAAIPMVETIRKEDWEMQGCFKSEFLPIFSKSGNFKVGNSEAGICGHTVGTQSLPTAPAWVSSLHLHLTEGHT